MERHVDSHAQFFITILDNPNWNFYAAQAMPNPDDLNAISSLMDEKLRTQQTELLVEMSKLRKELLDKMESQKAEVQTEICNVGESLRTEMRNLLREATREIINGVADLLDQHLHPQIDKLEKRVERLEHHTHSPGVSTSIA